MEVRSRRSNSDFRRDSGAGLQNRNSEPEFRTEIQNRNLEQKFHSEHGLVLVTADIEGAV